MYSQEYALGCPIWANKDWVGRFFAKGTQPRHFLQQYAHIFNTVEGNTTFYALPAPDTVLKWRDETPEEFRFCLKFHRTMTHDKRLRYLTSELDDFFRLFAPLGPRQGPFLLQLPPSFGPQELPSLRAFLRQLPTEHTYAVEVRHIEFFRYGQAEEDLNGILCEYGADRVILDSRGLHHAIDQGQGDLTERVQMRKPLLPVHYDTTGPHPFVRIISHPDLASNMKNWTHWARILSQWIDEGYFPYFFLHVPDNAHAPIFARAFHHVLQSVDQHIPDMPIWPIDQPPPGGQQIALF